MLLSSLYAGMVFQTCPVPLSCCSVHHTVHVGKKMQNADAAG
jgi:hypothetical protein